jgi:serine/threonine protein kinase
MELVEGESPKGPMSVDDAIRIAVQIASALEEAHDKGIVHRDLKPANIKVKPDGVVKVLDFGLAKVVPASTATSDDSPTLTAGSGEGVILGTAAYMSPEQARGKTVDQAHRYLGFRRGALRARDRRAASQGGNGLGHAGFCSPQRSPLGKSSGATSTSPSPMS